MASSPYPRLVLACALFSGWLSLLLSGFSLGGYVHFLAAAALIFFPWRPLA